MEQNKVKVGIIAAMQLEAEGIISDMTDIKKETVSGICFYSGNLFGKKAVVAVCGIGKVFAAVCAQTMILKYSPELVINTGIAGTLSDKIGIGDIVVADKLVQHDMDTSPLGDPVGMISGINVVYLPCSEKYSALLFDAAVAVGEADVFLGTVASGDRFVSTSSEKARIKELFAASACEMEGASVGQVCFVNGVECCVMRAISDGGDENAFSDYPTFARFAAERGTMVIKKFFELL